MSGPEHHLQQAILLALGKRKDLRLWRQNGGVATSEDGSRWVRFGIPGCADLSGVLADGRRLEIEVKRPGGQLSDQQRAFQAMIERFNGVYIVARSVDEALAGVEAAQRGGTKA